ncbi:MAG: 2-oxoglutarate dehydrogenase E1 component [Planctomycetota bacterium]|nr:2-oxoglutarate dehydrogenase E1 component [Planctomycetota bacterium]
MSKQGTTKSSAAGSTLPSVNGWQGEYLEGQYSAWKADPDSVTPDVRAFFQGFDLGSSGQAAAAPLPGSASPFQSAVDELIEAYRQQGHLAAKLDPFSRARPRPEALNPAKYGLTQADLTKRAEANLSGLSGSATLAEVIAHLEDTYCRSVGVEFMHIQNTAERQWFLGRFEHTRGVVALSSAERIGVLEDLAKGEVFEAFLAKRYGSEKRFSLEGGITLIPMMNQSIEQAAALGGEEMVVGMAHRGRLNVLINVMGKTYAQVFTEFEDNWEAGFADGGGDVKYHRGYSDDRKTSSGRTVHLTMASNPSHLESVNPVVLGRARAKQRLINDTDRTRVLPLLIHGDGAVAGQGIVSECLNMSQLEGYTVGGTLHIVINNQIAFTTLPEDGRSTIYCTDIAKAVEAPIFHVNGEDPEACVQVARLAVEYRQKFKKDIFIDLWCFRKYGHNEGDEQSFTQPTLAAMIKNKHTTLATFTQKLLEQGVIPEAKAKQIADELDAQLDSAQAKAKLGPIVPTIDPGCERWSGINDTFDFGPIKTAVSTQAIAEVCAALGKAPADFAVNPKLKALLEERGSILTNGQVSYATGELLAFGTLMLEGTHVRLSGQDCRRGTFTHRHAVIRDFNTGTPYVSLNNMRPLADRSSTKPVEGKQSELTVFDSPLSEYAVMGFDYGYSMADPSMLVMWEGQFGDFANGAQIMIDQYIASSEIKWSRWSGLVLLLPHGYEGAGPEHSSARLERFLSLCADDNMQVIYPTTGAQIFHALRRQLKAGYRKPLIVMSPKSLLRTPTSTVDELTSGCFQELIDDPAFTGKDAFDKKAVKRVIVCSGKVYFELVERRKVLGIKDIAIVRIEQLYPFHAELAKKIIGAYPKTAERFYVQEEPRNAGAFIYAADFFREQAGIDLKYIGRHASATPCVGSKRADKAQQEAVLTAAIGAKPKDDKKK